MKIPEFVTSAITFVAILANIGAIGKFAYEVARDGTKRRGELYDKLRERFDGPEFDEVYTALEEYTFAGSPNEKAQAESLVLALPINLRARFAVVSFAGDELVLDSSYRPTNQYIAPVHVNGSKSFRLLAVSDHNDRKEGLNRRPGPLLRALGDSSAFCQHDDLVVAGDFNNNPQWDKPNGPNNMARISQELLKRGLVSLYHHGTGLSFGAETQGTYWHYRDQMKSYHIDYIFVPTAWLKNMVSFDIGSFDDWCAPGLSDHAPLSAEFN